MDRALRPEGQRLRDVHRREHGGETSLVLKEKTRESKSNAEDWQTLWRQQRGPLFFFLFFCEESKGESERGPPVGTRVRVFEENS